MEFAWISEVDCTMLIEHDLDTPSRISPRKRSFSSEINWTRDKYVGIQVLTARARDDCMPFELGK
jgi:hypothetical protein